MFPHAAGSRALTLPISLRAAVLLAALLLSACAGPSHISAREFKSQYEAGHMQTMQSATYLGQRDGRAYMRISSMSLINPKVWTDKVVYVELSELDDAFRNSLPSTPLPE